MRNLLRAAGFAAGLLAVAGVRAGDAGQKAYEACIACHSLKAGEHGVGPSLHAVLGSTAGTAEGFRFSGPMKRSGIVWSRQTLTDFLRDPQAVVPNTRMPFSGMSDEPALKALVEYIEKEGK